MNESIISWASCLNFNNLFTLNIIIYCDNFYVQRQPENEASEYVCMKISVFICMCSRELCSYNNSMVSIMTPDIVTQ